MAPVSYNYKDVPTLEREGLQHHLRGEQHGVSVFFRDGDEVFHTYSTYGRGPDLLIGTYNYLDLTPLGRQEQGTGIMLFPHHDTYPASSQPVPATVPAAAGPTAGDAPSCH